jgi:23S rRNA (adenine2503-C2)-methyltransferase
MNELVPLKDFTPTDLELWIQEAGQPAYRARQLLKWIYAQNVEDFQKMTDVSKDFRGWLEQHARIPSVMREKVLTDKDGTRKLLFRLLDGERIESVLIEEERRLTLCVSSQVGCAFGCSFCLTGEKGYKRNLSAGEIVDQICAARRELGPEERITNLVFMGMGEPLANLQQVAKALEIITSDHGLNFSMRQTTRQDLALCQSTGATPWRSCWRHAVNWRCHAVSGLPLNTSCLQMLMTRSQMPGSWRSS